jgi:ABC-type antimicrobial peptide transport system permease subunit
MNFGYYLKTSTESILGKINWYYFLGVFSGFLVVTFLIFFHGMKMFEFSIEKGFDNLGTNNIQVVSVSYGNSQGGGLKVSDLKVLEQSRTSGIRAVKGFLSQNALVRANGFISTAIVKAVSSQYNEFRNFEIMGQGNFILDFDVQNFRNVVVVNSTFAEKYFKKYDIVGETILLDNLKGGQEQYQIIGVMKDDQSMRSQRLAQEVVTEIFIPISNGIRFFGVGSMDYVEFKLSHSSLGEQLGESILRSLKSLNPNSSYSIIRPVELLNQRSTVHYYLSVMKSFFILIFLVLGLFTMFFGVSFMVKMNKQEFAFKILLGASRKDIKRQIILQTCLLNFLGSLAGLLVGLILIGFLGLWMRNGLYINTGYVISSILLTMILGYLACLVPAGKASKVIVKEHIERD